MQDVPRVPVQYLNAPNSLAQGDVVAVPEGYPDVTASVQNLPIRRFVIALNWDYIYRVLPGDSTWRSLGVERVLTHSPFIGDFVSWSMRLPVTVFRWGINSSLYFPQNQKRGELVYLARKQDGIDALRKTLFDRDPRFLTHLGWTPLDMLPEMEYAAIVRRAFVFLNLSRAEGLPCAPLEAMRCNTLVAGYNSIGGQRELIGSGPKQNAILAETLDYPTLAARLEPLLVDMLKGDINPYAPILQNAFTTAAGYDQESEESSILAMWREFLPSAGPQ
jgi:hypothetical protein